MKKLTFLIEKLPACTQVGKWKIGVEKDLQAELAAKAYIMWSEDENDNLIAEVTVSMELEELTICVMKNLHAAIII